MSSPFFYLAVLFAVTFGCAFLCVYCTASIVQVSNGFSLLDPEISNGLKVRKWFLSLVVFASSMRCVSCIIEFGIFTAIVVREDLPVSTISYYTDNSETSSNKHMESSSIPFHREIFNDSIIPRTVMALRTLPLLCFLSYYALVCFYITNMYLSAVGHDTFTLRLVWGALNAVVYIYAAYYIIVQPNIQSLDIICLSVVSVYMMLLVTVSSMIRHFYTRNSSFPQSNGLRRVFLRLSVMTIISLAALFVCGFLLFVEWDGWFAKM